MLPQGIKRFLRPASEMNEKRKVDFIVCGVQKGGTSAMDAYLRAHPEVCMADQKEVHFFDNEDYFKDRPPDYSKYHHYFSPSTKHKVIGETTPIYMYWRDAVPRIWQYNPELKLVVVLRNPVERAYSHWNMERLRGGEHLSFMAALKKEQDRCREALPYQHRIYSYVDRGFYLEQLRRIWSFFPRDNTLVLKNEDLRTNALETLNRVFAFLGVSPVDDVAERMVHTNAYEAPISAAEKKYLRSVYEFEIRGLERLLGWDCQDWLSD